MQKTGLLARVETVIAIFLQYSLLLLAIGKGKGGVTFAYAATVYQRDTRRTLLFGMLRRSVLELASRSSISKVPSFLASRRFFSVTQENKPDSSRKTQSHSAKFIAGSVLLGSAFLAAYSLGYLDRYLKKEKLNNDEQSRILEELYSHDKATEGKAVESTDQLEKGNLLDSAQRNLHSDDITSASVEEKFTRKSLEVKSDEERSEAVEVAPNEDSHESYIAKDGKLVLDFLQALHAAEKRQAELDSKSFAAEKKVLKEKYEKDLKDARIREVMYAEREAMLEKELNKERARGAAALKSLQDKSDETLKKELELK
ncbi:hypothetical protein M569_07577, partial [Genlisea aurea]